MPEEFREGSTGFAEGWNAGRPEGWMAYRWKDGRMERRWKDIP